MKDVIRYIVRFSGSSSFAHSYGASDSMYDDLSVAKRQAKEVGDQVFMLNLTALGEPGFQIPWSCVFTRTEAVKHRPTRAEMRAKRRAKREAEAFKDTTGIHSMVEGNRD